jgi:hypothetical protein
MILEIIRDYEKENIIYEENNKNQWKWIY